METPKFKFVIIASEGVDFRREPTLNPKTMDGKDNIILRLPIGTSVVLENNEETRDNDGQVWWLVSIDNGNEKGLGWVRNDGLTQQNKFLVSAPESTDLRREPSMKSKAEDGKENIILSLPLGTNLIQLSDVHSNDGYEWILVKLDSKDEEGIGWVTVSHLIPQVKFIVAAPEGTDFCREPTLKPKTEDGRDNVIVALPIGTFVTVLSANSRTNDGHEWIFIRPEIGELEEIGWAIIDNFLPERPLAQAPAPGASPPTYPLKFGDATYKIFADKLVTAVTQQFIFTTGLSGLKEITVTVNGKDITYFSDQDKINAMKHPSRQWIT